MTENPRDYLSERDLYLQLAEEAAELAQAAAKKVRKLDGTNPTPHTTAEIDASVREEYTDVVFVASQIGPLFDDKIHQKKRYRWVERLELAARDQKIGGTDG